MPLFEEERAYCFAHVSQSYLSICPSVTFSFPINNSRKLWPTFLKLCPPIRPGPIDYGVTGSKVKVTGVKSAKTDKISNVKN